MQRHIKIMRVEASCQFSWALFWNFFDCESRPTWCTTRKNHWIRGGQQVYFANYAVAARRICLSGIERSVWYFGKRKSSELSKIVCEGSKTVIWNSRKEPVGCPKGSTCFAVIPEPYRTLPLPVPSKYGSIPTTKTATLQNMVRILAFTNKLHWWQIPTGALIWYLRGDC